MPLIRGKSKKAFDENLSTELHSGKPKDQSLAIAYSMKRHAKKKMAEGGRVEEDSKITTDSRDSDELGMLDGETSFPKSSTLKDAGTHNVTVDSLTPEEMSMIKRHRMADGGMVPNFKDEGMDGIDSDQSTHGKSMLDGHSTMGRKEKSWTEDGHTTIDDAGTDRDRQMIEGKSTRHSDEKRAASGRPDADDESEGLDMVGKIMGKRKKYAEGGMVDLDDNSMEHANGYYKRNEDAALKENYDEDFKFERDPMDSNEHGHDLSDEHDMVSSIRKKLKMRKM